MVQKRDVDNVGFFLGLLGFLFQMCAVVGYGWWSAKNSVYAYGGNPFELYPNGKTPGKITSVQAFLIIGVIFTFFSFIFERLNKFREFIDGGRTHLITAILWIFSAICMVVALGCYTSWYNDVGNGKNKNYGYSWSYGLGWCSAVIQLLGGAAFMYWSQL